MLAALGNENFTFLAAAIFGASIGLIVGLVFAYIGRD